MVNAPRLEFNLSSLYTINAFTPDSAKSKIDKLSKITNEIKLKNKHHYSKLLLNSFPINGNTLGFIESKVKKLFLSIRERDLRTDITVNKSRTTFITSEILSFALLIG